MGVTATRLRARRIEDDAVRHDLGLGDRGSALAFLSESTTRLALGFAHFRIACPSREVVRHLRQLKQIPLLGFSAFLLELVAKGRTLFFQQRPEIHVVTLGVAQVFELPFQLGDAPTIRVAAVVTGNLPRRGAPSWPVSGRFLADRRGGRTGIAVSTPGVPSGFWVSAVCDVSGALVSTASGVRMK